LTPTSGGHFKERDKYFVIYSIVLPERTYNFEAK
jgi:hypothetical protein